MNIVIATRFYPPDTGGGGIAAYAQYLAMGLRARGHKVRVISRRGAKSICKTVVDGIEIHRIGPLNLPYQCHRLPIVGQQTRFINDVLYAIAVRGELLRMNRDTPPDLVEYADIHAESLFHPFWLCPAVVKLHTPQFVLDRYYGRRKLPCDARLIHWAERWAILRASALSSPSRGLADQIVAEYGLQAERIAPMPNGIDASLFSPPEGEQAGPPTVLFVGRLQPMKGVLVFADAIPLIAEACPGARFLFVGADRSSRNGTSQRQELQARFANEGIRQVAFEGHAGPEVFRDHYRRASVFVMPSLFENCPYTLLEAMACGRAIVATRAHGMQEIIVDGMSGLLFEPSNPTDLAEKVILLLRDPELRQRLGAAARTAVTERYTMEEAAAAAERFYQKTIVHWRFQQSQSRAPNNMNEAIQSELMQNHKDTSN